MATDFLRKVEQPLQNQVDDMAKRIAVQAKKLKQLEQRLQKEKHDKANLEADFQNVLDQLAALNGHRTAACG